MNISLDRKRGCLFGLAVGDALGAAVEFKSPGTFPLVTGYRDGGPHRLNPGEWTDDTSMALALANSLSRGWDLNDQLIQYTNWWLHGDYSVNGRCFDIGSQTRAALNIFHYKLPPSASQLGRDGNGSIMRLAPVVIRYADESLERIGDLAELSSTTTHTSYSCRSACRILGTALWFLMRGWEKERVANRALPFLSPLDSLISQIARGSYRTKQPPEIKGMGWVVKSLEAALWAFYSSNSFEEAVLKAVNLGNDADTTGAVCGQLAGAYWGESGIPKHLIEGLARKDMIETALKGLGC